MSEIIHAKDCKENTDYLLVISPASVYKVTVVKINKIVDNRGKETVSSVSVKDERYPGQPSIAISGETALLEFDEAFYNDALLKRKSAKANVKEKAASNKETNKSQDQIKNNKEETMARKKNPRSHIIDQCLAAVPAGQTPDWNKIVEKVIESGRGTTEEAKNIIFQAKLRHKWYTVDGETNPFAAATKTEA